MAYGAIYWGLFETLRSQILPLPPVTLDVTHQDLSEYEPSALAIVQLLGAGIGTSALAEFAIYPLNTLRYRSMLRGTSTYPGYQPKLIAYKRRVSTTIPFGTTLLEDMLISVKQAKSLRPLYTGLLWKVTARAPIYGTALAAFACLQNIYLIRSFTRDSRPKPTRENPPAPTEIVPFSVRSAQRKISESTDVK